jgi:hypothetical protein
MYEYCFMYTVYYLILWWYLYRYSYRGYLMIGIRCCQYCIEIKECMHGFVHSCYLSVCKECFENSMPAAFKEKHNLVWRDSNAKETE